MGLRETISSVFSFLGARSQSEERIAQYVIREHRRGRPVDQIVADRYVTNRCTDEQVRRLLDRPDVIRAIGEDTVAAARSRL